MMEYENKVAEARKKFEDTVIRIDRKLGNLGSLRGSEGRAKRKRMHDLPNCAKAWIHTYCQNAEKIWTGKGSHGAIVYVSRKLIEHPQVVKATAAYLEAMEARAEAQKARAEERKARLEGRSEAEKARAEARKARYRAKKNKAA